MDTARIAVLLEAFLLQPLPRAALEQISTYIDILCRWNARINLTAVRDPEAIVTRHFGESFFLARHLFPEPVERTFLSAQTVSTSQRAGAPLIAHAAMSGRPPHAYQVVDIGSGAGFPGLPVKIWAPSVRLTLVESNHKKAAFLREVTRALTLTDVNVTTERAESLLPGFPPVQWVTLRAVERFETILPLAARFLAPSGRLALLIGSSQASLLPTLVPNLHWLSPIPIPQSKSRVLTITSI